MGRIQSDGVDKRGEMRVNGVLLGHPAEDGKGGLIWDHPFLPEASLDRDGALYADEERKPGDNRPPVKVPIAADAIEMVAAEDVEVVKPQEAEVAVVVEEPPVKLSRRSRKAK